MSKPYSVGTSVEWNWASGTGSGTIEAIFTTR